MITDTNSVAWTRYFARNTARPLSMDIANSARLTPDERRTVVQSIQQFQLGESGQGRHLLACARRHAARAGDPAYPEALQRFVYEEQRHAGLLAQYLSAIGELTIEKCGVDSAFRFLRHLMGLEICLIVLSTAEVVATVYYRALRDATGCPALRAICQRILCDEAMHLAFHRERFGVLWRNRPFVCRCISRLMHHTLLFGTNFVVWWYHASVLQRGGIGLVQFQFRTHRTLYRQHRRIGLRQRLRKLIRAAVPSSGPQLLPEGD